jgi:methionine-rich copper-binding protein CopC
MATTTESITSYYKNILGREPDAAGLAYWTAQVESGGAKLSDVVTSFTTSTESVTTVQPIIALYQAAFGRTPDTAGLQYWTQQVRSGASLDDVTHSFAGSTEFANVAGGSVSQLVSTLYQNTLGRAPDAAGLAYWSAQLSNGGSVSGLLSSITASPEGQSATADKAQVVLTYQAIVGRSPSNTELNTALQSKGAQSTADLVNKLATNLITNGDPATAPTAPATPTTPVNPVTPVDPPAPQPTEFTFKPKVGSTFGSSDASGVVAWGNYIIVGDDEANVVRVYDKNGGPAISEFDYGTALGLTGEMDFEAMTLVGSNLYLTGSHSNDKKGVEAPGREVITSLKITAVDGKPTFSVTTDKYTGLVAALTAWDASGANGKAAGYYGFATSAGAGIAPENTNGFSIEGMTTSSNDSALWLGFRAPQMDNVARDKALIIAVTNYKDVLADSTKAPNFEAIELNLGGRGIRSIDKASDGSGYLIIAGPSGSASADVPNDFRLFTWDGDKTHQPVERDNNLDALLKTTGGSFESIASPTSITAGTQILLLQDNGDTVWAGQTQASKDLNAANQQFKGNLVTVGNAVTDTTAPKLVGSTPADAATGVSKNTSSITLTFDEGVALGSGKIVLKDGNGNVVQTFDSASTGVKVDYNKVILTPTAKLAANTQYSVELQSNAVADHYNNAIASQNLSFKTGEVPHYNLLISEVASNSTGGDFVELYNYGTTTIDLSNWKFTDSDGKTFVSGVSLGSNLQIAAGKTLVIASVKDSAAGAFKTAWNLTGASNVINVDGPGLGKGDGVVIYDQNGNVATSFNYGAAAFDADGTSIATSAITSGTFKAGSHTGTAFGGLKDSYTAVWDQTSTSDPHYTYAKAGALGAYAQVGDANSIGSPGVDITLTGQPLAA